MPSDAGETLSTRVCCRPQPSRPPAEPTRVTRHLLYIVCILASIVHHAPYAVCIAMPHASTPSLRAWNVVPRSATSETWPQLRAHTRIDN